MMKVAKIKTIVFISLIASFLLCPNKIFALDYLKPSQVNEYKNYDYVIDSYDINIVVNENNKLDITENITAYFHVPKHGIFRTLPLMNQVVRLDGTTSTNRARVSHVKVNHEFSKEREDNNYKIKIGSASKTLVGEQKYQIRYTYHIGRDKIKDYDELYYNIIGMDWDTVIGGITFHITMPKDFDASKLGFSSGQYGSTNTNLIQYTVDGNTIQGSYTNILQPHEALTVRLELEDGYFVYKSLVNTVGFLMILIPIVGVILSYILWKKYGKDDPVIETVEFYPPKGLNSLDVGYLYKGQANHQDVTSLLVYLANKGYIKITEIEKKGLFSKSNDFKITKLKEYDGTDKNEKLFLEGLFEGRTGFDVTLKIFGKELDLSDKENKKESKQEVTSKDLYNSFYLTMNRILSNVNGFKNKHKVFEKITAGKSFMVILLILLSLLTIFLIPTIEYGDPELVMATIIFLLFFTIFYVLGFYKKIPVVSRILIIAFTSLISFAVFAFLPIGEAMLDNRFYLISVPFGMICVIGMLFCLQEMPRRTKYGTEMLGKIRGFKNFLETVEKEKLEAMVMENPTYFYDILPFTYVLGVSDKWIKKFEKIALQEPDWYDGYSTFNVNHFGTFMNNTVSSARSAMASHPSSSSGGSGGGFSGGGFSGGGSGGGGGGSW